MLQLHQIAWRQSNVSSRACGTYRGVKREWILSPADWEQGLWPGLRGKSPNSLPSYLKANGVQRHTGSNNLKSSRILCANLYFPFRDSAEGRELLANFLRVNVSDKIETVEEVELEFEGAGMLAPATLLGEQGGSRGAGQTSPDVVFVVNKGCGIVLTESKLAEHSFYGCSARTRITKRNRLGNPDPTRCQHAVRVLTNANSQCHQATWGRKYFDRLSSVAVTAAWAKLRCCPAAKAGYQLFRQQALAEGLIESGSYDLVVSCVARDARNKRLQSSLKSTGLLDIAGWGGIFCGRATFAVFTHQEWVSWVRAHGAIGWREWSDWITSRYGIA
jgi:hypothetical protein